MTTQNAPYQFGTTQGDLGHSYVFAAEDIRLELADRLDMLGLAVVPLVGDLAGSGSDVVRVTSLGNVGFARRMGAMTAENDPITASTLTTGYTTVTLGQYGLAEEETYKQQLLSRERGVTLDVLKGLVPESWLATFRYNLCVLGSGFTTAVGSAAANVDRDDYLDLIAEYDETLGSGMAGMPVVVLSGKSWTRISQSWAGHAAFQNSAEDYASWVARNGRQDKGVRLGMRVLVTDDVQQSGGAYVNFSFEPGAVGWARASTTPITPANPQGAVYVPDFGLLIEEITGGGNVGTRRYEARAWFGMDQSSSATHVARRLLDKVA